jgi:hypothetical protein
VFSCELLIGQEVDEGADENQRKGQDEDGDEESERAIGTMQWIKILMTISMKLGMSLLHLHRD